MLDEIGNNVLIN